MRGPEVFKNHRFALKMDVNGCHPCVCSLFQVIKHISTGLFVFKLPATCPHKKYITVTYFILHTSLCDTQHNGTISHKNHIGKQAIRAPKFSHIQRGSIFFFPCVLWCSCLTTFLYPGEFRSSDQTRPDSVPFHHHALQQGG